ncbi:MAG: DUF4129 domain-containing protein [Dehalococcoidales bacterium]|nr:DUF4129 domain-containing protein [Dehalococcoidales bacterium]
MTIFLSRLAKIDWIADILSPLTVMLMEALVVYPWLVFLGKWPALTVQRTPLSLLALICLFAISYITTKFFLSRKWSLRWIQMSIIACGLVTIFIVLRIEYGSGFGLLSSQWFTAYGQALLDSFSHPHPFVFALPVGLYLWWRGISLSRSLLYFANIYTSFLIGLGTLSFLVILWGITFRNEPVRNLASDIGIYVAGFFFFGLISLALSNLRIIQERMKAKGELSKTFGRRWLLIISGVIGGIVLVSIGFASIFSTQFISTLGRILNSVSDVLYKIVYYLLLPLGYLAQWLYYLGKLLINWFRGGQEMEPFEIADMTNPENLSEATKGAISPEVIQTLKWSVLALVLIVAVFLITRTIKRGRSRVKEEIDEEQESLWSWDGFKSDLKIFLDMLFGRFKRKQKPVSVSPSLRWQTDEDKQRRLSIREIYQHLLWQANRLRIPRESYETPYEYAQRMGRAVPDGKEPLNELTHLYIDVRYGEHPVEEEKIDAANNLWHRLHDVLKRFEGN